MRSPAPGQRALEIEEFTNRTFVHPTSAFLVRLCIKARIPPNAVSLVGLACGLLAGVAYYGYRDIVCAAVGFLLMIAWHVMDGADGQLARATNSASELGRVLDGACDYVTFIAVYAAFALAGIDALRAWVWPLIVGAGLCHAAQSAAYEREREEYNFWSRYEDAHAATTSRAPRRASPPQGSVLRGISRSYAKLQGIAAGATFRAHARLTEIVEADPARAREVVALYRQAFAPVVRRWAILSSNYRTIGIFLTALFAVPQAYFLFEIVGFSAILIGLRVYTRAKYKTFFAAVTPRRSIAPS